MSTTVDQRVVQMEFDNKNFEKKVGSTLGLLDKLKEKLRFDGASKGLENVERAASKVNLNPISKAAETISSKFSALEVMGVTALANITNSAVNAGKKLVAAFTIDPVKSGFQEYETQINAVQTILANTESKGSTLKDVNKALDELNKYADMTIYNFTEMTRNIGTFTAAGVDLKTSVSAIKGIANLAAVSGSTSQQASTAMYQLSQALAAGTVKLQDWNSVVNAGMGGQVFQDALKETARAHGLAIDQMIKDEGSFRETLKKGWLSSEVLTETLSKFTGDLNARQLKTMGYTDEQITAIIKMGKTANDAATKVKTFSQLWDTLNEAAQSGWTQTWELIVGDFEEAKAFLTSLSDRFSDIINKTSDARNNLLKGALSAKDVTMDDWKKLENEGIVSETFILALTNAAKKHGVAIDEMIEQEGSFQDTLKNGWLNFEILSSALTNYEEIVTESTGNMADKLEYFQTVVDKVWNGDYASGTERIKALTDAGYDYAKVQELVNKTVDGHRLTLEDLSETQMENLGFTKEQINELKALKEQAEKTGTPLNELIEKLKRPSGRTLLIESLNNALEGITKILTKIGNVWRVVFTPTTSDDIYGIIKRVNELSEKFANCDKFANQLARAFRGLFAAIDLVKSVASGALKAAFTLISKLIGATSDSVLNLVGSVSDAVFYFNKWVKENDIISKGFSGLVNIILGGVNVISKWINELMKLPQVQSAIEKTRVVLSNFIADVGKKFEGSGQKLKDFIESVKQVDKVGFEGVKKRLEEFLNSIVGKFTNLNFSFDGIEKKLSAFNSILKQKFTEVEITFDSFGGKVKKFVDYVKDKFSNLTFGKVFAIASIAGLVVSAKKIGDAIEALSGPLEAITGILETFQEIEKAAVGLINNISKSFKALKNVLNAAALIEMAVAVSIFAGAIALLAKIDNQDKIGNAVGALSLLMVTMTGLFAVIAAIGSIKKGSFKDVAVVMATLGASILALAGALKILDSLNNDNIVKNALVIAGLSAAMATLVGILGAKVPQLSKGSITMVALAASIKIVVDAIATMDKLNADSVKTNVESMAKIMGLFVVVMRVCGKVKWGAAGTLLSLVVSLKILLTAFHDLEKFDSVTIENSLVSIKRIFESFALVMIASLVAGKNAGKAGAGILAMSTALLVLTAAIAILGKMDVSTISRATTVINDIFEMFALLTAVSLLAGKNATKAGVMMLLMSTSLAILSGVIAILAQIAKENPEGLENAVTAIRKLETCFVVLIAVSKLAADSKGTIIAITVGIGILATALAALSMINPEGLYPATIAISSLMAMFALIVASTGLANNAKATLIIMALIVGEFAAILVLLNGLDANTALATAGSLSLLLMSLSGSIAILSKVDKVSKSAYAAVGIMTLVVAALGGIFWALQALNVKPSLETALSLSTLLLALSAACAILATLGKSGGVVAGAAKGAAALGIFITIVGAFMVGLGALVNYIPQCEVFLDKGISVLEKIGTGLGRFVGGFVGGIAQGALGAIGQGLSDFMDNLSGFIEGSKQIDDKVVSGIKGLAETMLILTGTGILNGIGALLGSNNSLKAFGEELKGFAEPLIEYANKVKGIDFSGVEGSANAARMLAEFAKNIPNQGGWLADWIGDNTLSSFATELSEFAEPLIEYANKVRDVDFSGVEGSANAALLIARFADNIPNQGGKLAEWIGDNTLTTFATELSEFAGPLIEYANKVKDVDFSGVEGSTNAALMITEFAKNIPNEGGALAWWVGDNTLTAFATELSTFAPSIVSYAACVKDIDFSGVEGSLAAARMLATFETELPKHDSVLSWFKGDATLSEFGVTLVSFGLKFSEYYGYVKDIRSDVLSSTTIAARSLAALANNLPEDKAFKSDTIDCFGKDLAAFGKKFADYYSYLDDVDTTKLAAVTKEVENVVKMAKNAITIDTAKFGSFGTALATVGKNGLDNFIEKFKNASSTIESTGKKVLDDFITGVNAKKDSLTMAFNNMLTTAINALNDSKTSFRNAGKSVIGGIIEGADDNKTELTTAISNIITASITKAKDAKTSFENAGKDFIEKLESGIKSKSSKVITAASDTVKDAIKALGKHKDDMKEAGADFVKGFAKGIEDNIYRVKDQAVAMGEASISALRLAIDAHSPARKTFEAGEDWGDGYKLGIQSKSNDVKKASARVADLSLGPLRLMTKSESEILGKSTSTTRSWANERVKETKKSTSKITTIFGEFLDGAKDKLTGGVSTLKDSLSGALDSYSDFSLDSIADQSSYYDTSSLINQNGVNDILSSQNNLLDGLEDVSKETEELKEDDLANETGYWANRLRILRQGEEAEKYQSMSFVEYQKDILSQTIEIYNKYYDELESRTSSFMNATSLFNAVSESEETISKDDLIKNLKGQTLELYNYGTVVTKLEKRLFGTKLWDYVKELGTDSIKELQAINSMTDAELSTYADMYEVKYTLATANARNQLKELKETTETSLDNLYGISGTKLEEFSQKFDGTFDSLTAYVEKASEIGANISAGVATGMAEGTEQIETAASTMIDNVETAAKDAAEIHSPSKRIKREVGVPIVEGIATAIETMHERVSSAFVDLMNDSIKELQEMKDSFKMAATTLMDGFIEGITSSGQQAIAQAQNIANTIANIMSSSGGGTSIASGINLSNATRNAGRLDLSYSTNKASNVSGAFQKIPTNSYNNAPKSSGNTYTFTQNNYSPKSLSSTDIYRQTKNQFAAMERMLRT